MKLAYLLKVASRALVILSIICKWISQIRDMHSPKACSIEAQRVDFYFVLHIVIHLLKWDKLLRQYVNVSICPHLHMQKYM